MVAIPQRILDLDPGLNDWSILLGYRGSVAHGMKMDPKKEDCIDDVDFISVCVPPPSYYLGLKTYGSDGTKETTRDEFDIVTYELRKMVRLLENGNPNVLSALWLKPNLYIKLTNGGQHLIDNRDLFIGKHVYHSFVGYANAQLKKMTALAYQGYMGEKRKQLVDKFGYDTKNASHLIRLLRMAIEFLGDGDLQVFRNDAYELLQIKRGEWALEKIMQHSEDLFKLAREAYAYSPLPPKPDHEKISKLCRNIIMATWDENKNIYAEEEAI